jgi:S-adenosylmethionine-diacylglycerol 3-amino-3-carboxypropyl transferase
MSSEVVQRADFTGIRYAQCWEDADILMEALQPGPGKRCLSIASAGDNSLAMLAFAPEHVLAIDLSAAQLACLALRVAAYRCLQHHELLQLIGSRGCSDRGALYRHCRDYLAVDVRAFWDQRTAHITRGIGSVGKFEEYFRLFRTRVLPLIHSQKQVAGLLESRTMQERETFYDQHWNNWRWQLLFRIFFSRRLMGMLGRSPAFFEYVEGSVAERILERTHHALTELDPAQNPYLHWILTGAHGAMLPFAMREENFEAIRRNLDRLEWRCSSVEDALGAAESFDCFNLSDIFEYMSPASYEQLLRTLIVHAKPAARLAYWNMLAPRNRPAALAELLDPLAELSNELFAKDKAFFYSAFIVEQVR